MKVLQLPNSYLPWKTGGKEVYTHELAKHLKKLGIDIQVVIHKKSDEVEEGIYHHEDIPVRVLPPVKINDFLRSRFTREIDEAPGFEDLILEYQPDLIHFHDQNDGASLTHLKIAKQHGIKTMITYHSPGQSCPQKALLHKGKEVCDGELIINRCSLCTLISNDIPTLFAWPVSKIHFSNSSNNKIGRLLNTRNNIRLFKDSFFEFVRHTDIMHVHAKWVYELMLVNNVPEHKLKYISTKPWSKSVIERNENLRYPGRNTLRLVFIGRCIDIKGVHILIDAVQMLDNKRYPVEVHFLGPYWERSNYGGKLWDRVKDDPRFKIPRLVPNNKLHETLAAYDVCVIPSLWPETGPLTVYDAWTAGLPVIGSDFAGISELIHSGKNGLLFKRNDAEDLKDKIQHFFDDPNLIEKLRANLSFKHSFSDFAYDMFKMYQSIIGHEK